MQNVGTINIGGARNFKVIKPSDDTAAKRGIWAIVKKALPLSGLKTIDAYRLRNLLNIWRGFWRIAIARALRVPHVYGLLYAKVIKANGDVINLGLVSMRVVTDAGVAFIVDAFQNSVELENMKYHGFGTGTTNEAAGDTTLVTELTTQYATDNTRPTGSLTEGASANIFRTVGTLSPDASVAITEHGIFSQAANSGGTLLDRSKFSAINLVSGDSLQVTYDLTVPSGS